MSANHPPTTMADLERMYDGPIPPQEKARVRRLEELKREAALVAKAHLIPELVEALEDIREYLDQRADADAPPGGAGFLPNEEMTLLVNLDAVLANVNASRSKKD